MLLLLLRAGLLLLLLQEQELKDGTPKKAVLARVGWAVCANKLR